MNKPEFAFKGLSEVPTKKMIRTFMEQMPDAMLLHLIHGVKSMWDRFGLSRVVDWGDFNYWWAGDAFTWRNVWFYDPSLRGRGVIRQIPSSKTTFKVAVLPLKLEKNRLNSDVFI